MTNIVGVRFRMTGKIYYFAPKDLELKRGTHVIVETARGMEYGTVILGPKDVPDDQVVQPLREVIRIATEDDEEREFTNRFHEREAYKICKEKILEHNLDMKLIQAEYTFDNNKLLFYFTAEGRIDFRDLVKDLAGIFRTRIELRQIGVRDETKILGGIGICGRELCCHTFLSDFAPVSIKMAKEQNLSLNPTKISGTCGRLMCCLNNEAETYHYLNSKLPKNGEIVKTIDGFTGKVQNVSVLRQHVKVIIEKGDEREIREYPVEEIGFRGHEPQPRKQEEEIQVRHTELAIMPPAELAVSAAAGAVNEGRSGYGKKNRQEPNGANGENRSGNGKKNRSDQNGKNGEKRAGKDRQDQGESRNGSRGKNRGPKDPAELENRQDPKGNASENAERAGDGQSRSNNKRRRSRKPKTGSGEGWDQAVTISENGGANGRRNSDGHQDQASRNNRQDKNPDHNGQKNSGKNQNSGKNGGQNRSQQKNPGEGRNNGSNGDGNRQKNRSDQQGSANGGADQKRNGQEGGSRENSGNAAKRSRRRRSHNHSQNKPQDGSGSQNNGGTQNGGEA